jgi:hypothetical protein
MTKKILFNGLLTLSLMLVMVSSVNAQGKFFTRVGFISFYSSTPVEDITAVNENVSVVLDSDNGAIEVQALMTAFQFKKALMGEHFNENYVESAMYPKATFVGTIADIDKVDLNKVGVFPVSVTGKLTIHGVTNDVSANGNIEIKDGNVYINSEFIVIPEDYDIEIPSTVREKIAKNIMITLKAKVDPLN